MKIFVVSCCLLVCVASAAFIPNVRLRRDVSELSADYLPPGEEMMEAVTELNDDSAADVGATDEPSARLSDNGYEYRTVRRLKYRNRVRRDVAHLSQSYLPPQGEYLPPNAERAAPKIASEYLPPAEAVAATEAPAVRAADDESEVVVNAEEAPEETAVLADDGYRYKQPEESAMLKIGEGEAENLPALQEAEVEAVGPQESAVLADDGYHYRAIKRYRL